MNAFGLHAMVLVSDWDESGSEKAIRSAAAIGYDVIEVPLFDPGSTDLDRTCELLRQHRLTPSVSLGLTAETDISSADLAIFGRRNRTAPQGCGCDSVNWRNRRCWRDWLGLAEVPRARH
jgi:hypothetical protein